MPKSTGFSAGAPSKKAILLLSLVLMLLLEFADRTCLPRYLHSKMVFTKETVHVSEGPMDPGQCLKGVLCCLTMIHDYSPYRPHDERFPAWPLVEK